MSIKTLVQWSPRVLSILFTLFLMLFSLDVFEMVAPWYEILLGLLIHNIPAFILIIVLYLSWKRPLVGAIIYTTVGILYGVWMLADQGIDQWLAILSLGIPAIIIGILFYMDYRLL